MTRTPSEGKLTRRAALTRIGLAAGAAYTAPAMIGFNAARASGASGASAASRSSGPSRNSGPSRSSGPSSSSGPSRNSGPSGMSRPSGPSSNRNGSTWRNSFPSRPRRQRQMTPAEAEAIRFFRSIFGG